MIIICANSLSSFFGGPFLENILPILEASHGKKLLNCDITNNIMQ